jgi:hypothetical protein
MRLLAVLAAAAAVSTGCGAEPLSLADEGEVARVVGQISFYCPHSDAPARPAPPHIVDGVERLIAIHDNDPDALYLEGSEEETSMSDLLKDMERQLRWCDPRIADRVKREL